MLKTIGSMGIGRFRGHPAGQPLSQTASLRANRVHPVNSRGGNWWQSALCGAHTDRHFRESPGFAGILALLVMAALPVLAQDAGISAERIREHTRFLSSDLLEGRGVGVRGGEIAAEYIATQLALAGAKPAGDHGTYYQKVPLVGIETEAGATLGAAVSLKGLDLRWGDDFVGVSETQNPDTRFEGEAVFV